MPRKKGSTTENRKVQVKKEPLQNERRGRKRKTDDQGIENAANEASNSSDISESQEIPRALPCKFVVQNAFRNVSIMGENGNYSRVEEHFGVPWCINISRDEGHLASYLHCVRTEDTAKWSIDTKYDLKIVHPKGKSVLKRIEYSFDKCIGHGHARIMKWEDMLKDYLDDDKLIVEAHVTINKMPGVYKDNLRSFDESMSEVSDVVLIVQDEKFYVSKLFLATHSPYFKTMFLGKFDESKKSEIELSGINSEDFQKYLEVLYGEAAIDEYAVEGILLIADMYDTPIVTRKCEEFMLEKSKKTLKKKLIMSVRYNLENLKKKCFSGIRTRDDIRSMMPIDVNDLDPSIANVLLEKALLLR